MRVPPRNVPTAWHIAPRKVQRDCGPERSMPNPSGSASRSGRGGSQVQILPHLADLPPKSATTCATPCSGIVPWALSQAIGTRPIQGVAMPDGPCPLTNADALEGTFLWSIAARNSTGSCAVSFPRKPESDMGGEASLFSVRTNISIRSVPPLSHPRGFDHHRRPDTPRRRRNRLLARMSRNSRHRFS
jgi:hypothetical protein